LSSVIRLREGASRWNSWRRESPDVRPDLVCAGLVGANLAGMNLSGAMMTLANLCGANLCGANLEKANLARVNLDDANLAGARLIGANLAGASLLRANFCGSSLRGANLAGGNFTGNADLSGADLSGANLAGVRLTGVTLAGANLSNAMLAGADLRNADLTGTDFTGTIVSGANFEGATLVGSSLDLGAIGEKRAPSKLAPSAPLPASSSPAIVEAPPPPPPVVRPEKEAPGPQCSYVSRDAAILTLHSGQIARKSRDEKTTILDLLFRYNESFFGVTSDVAVAVLDNVVVVAFSNPTDALRCGSLYNTILGQMGVESCVGITWGAITVREKTLNNRRVDGFRPEIVIDSLSPAASLMPAGGVGEVLILDEMYSNSGLDRNVFGFEPVTRQWRGYSSSDGVVTEVSCYKVRFSKLGLLR
jgi:uncharacterized protein YjbI with pentapeptide repeats